MYRRLLFPFLIAAAAASHALADSPSVTAVLSSSEAAVGETVQLQIRVTGSGEARVPEDISVDGLEVHRTGTSRQFEMRNFTTTSSVTYNYTILPLKAGKFTIPPQTINIGSETRRTPELTLNVTDSPNQTAPATPRGSKQPPPTDINKLIFAELVLPKQSAYVGEMVPVQVRIASRVNFQLNEPPMINGQGLTMQKLQEPSKRLETIDGNNYEVLTFRTALAATRPGKIEIAPLEVKAVAMLPRSSRSGRSTPSRRSPFDIFNLDPFNDPFFGDPFANLREPQLVTIRSAPAELEVKPLPPNPPAGFSGAIGNFTMTADATPKSVKVGDPITVTSTITGRGNFDRVNAPALEDERGWHKYPPSSKFKQDDDVGISGAKTFETVLSPNEKKQSLPALSFAYFDPAKEQYVTLRSDPIPIQVEGAAASPAPAAVSPPASQASSPVPAEAKPQDILYQLTDFPRSVRSFTPLYARPVFWTVQLVPLALLLAFIGWKIRQARIDNRAARRLAALHQEAAELMRRLRRDDSSPQEYFLQASRAVQIKTALARNIDPNAVDAETAANAFELDEDSRAELRRLFARSDELRYSGESNGAKKVSAQDRDEVLELIEGLRT